MGYLMEIKESFGVEAFKTSKRIMNLYTRLAKLENRKIFLLRCRKDHILPKHITDGSKCIKGLLSDARGNILKRIGNFQLRLGLRTLNFEVEITFASIKSTLTSIDQSFLRLSELLPRHLIDRFSNNILKSFNKRTKYIKNKNIIKFNNLKSTVNIQSICSNNSKWVFNLSNLEIPSDIFQFLSLGSKFGLPITRSRIHKGELLADIESIIYNVPIEYKDILRARTSNILTNYFLHGERTPPINHILTHTYIDTIKYFKNHKDDPLMIMNADKGQTTVIILKSQYRERAFSLLNDVATYSLLNSDPTRTIQAKCNKMLKNLVDNEQISLDVYKQLVCYNGVSPKFYGLPKIHKVDCPLRPIVSFIGSPTYKLSSHIGKTLQIALCNKTNYNVVDTFDFVEVINNVLLPPGYVLVSLDVISLFTNIPLHLVIDSIVEDWELVADHTGISKDEFIKLLSFLFNCSTFIFDNKFYKQNFGTPMGSPCSPSLACIVLDRLLDHVIPTLPFNLPFLYKYVDDIITAIPSESSNIILEHFNSYHNSLQFTIELENNNSVPFLDTKVIRLDNQSIITDWYRKPTFSGRYINFYSSHPYNQKVNTLAALKNRILKISHPSFHMQNLNLLKQFFSNNGYPPWLINRILFNRAAEAPRAPNVVTDEVSKYIRFPYIPEVSHSIAALFKQFPIKLGYYNLFKNALFTKCKDKTPTEFKSGIVYSIPCAQCESIYIGQTKQYLVTRMKQHANDVKKLTTQSNKTALVEHCKVNNHNFNFDNVSILANAPLYQKRLFLEMFYIKLNNNAINFRSDMDSLSSIYSLLIYMSNNNIDNKNEMFSIRNNSMSP